MYLVQLKELMKNDKSLHPMMEKTLKLLKKSRTPYIMLSRLREMVIDPNNLRHYDRSAEPKGDWVCTIWSEEEAESFRNDSEGHIKSMFNMFEGLGYEFYDSKEVTIEYLNMLEDITIKQINAQMEQRNEIE